MSNHHSTDEEILDAIENRVMEDMNVSLRRDFDADEIKGVVFQMEPSTSPGPDGLPPLFFQKFWGIVGNDVYATLLSFLNSRNLLTKVNYTYITLIPKAKTPENMSQLQLSSLCNVLFKIASKVITNRLKPIIQHVVSYHQNAFIPGR